MTETQPHGIEKFISAVMNETQPIVAEIMKDPEFFEVMGNIVFDNPGARHVGLKPSSKEESFRKILSGFTEIEATFQTLKDIPYYMGHFPPKHPSISKNRFLNYHIGTYLNENYILRERLRSYQKTITRMYKGDRRLAEMGDNVKSVDALVSGFDGIAKTRGRHVHQERYGDEDLERLYIYERMAKEEGDDALVSVVIRLYPLALRDYRKKWIKIISENNEIFN